MTTLLAIVLAPLITAAPVDLDHYYSAQKLVADGASETIWEGVVTDTLCPSVVAQFGIASEDCTIELFKDQTLSVSWDAESSVWRLSARLTYTMNWTAVGGTGSVETVMARTVSGDFSAGTQTTWENFLDSQMCPAAEAALNLPSNLCTEHNFKQNGVGSRYQVEYGRWYKTARLDYAGTAEVAP